MRPLLIISIAAWLLPGPEAASQEALRGVVLDATSGEPLVGATVWIPEEQRGTTTDTDGRFRLEWDRSGDPMLRIQLVGYLSLERNLRAFRTDAEGLVIRLEQQPILVGETVITASRREQSLSRVPVSVTAIDASDLADRMAITLEEPLRYVSGVNVMDDQINVRGSSGYSRGVGSRVLLLFDGVPLLTGDTGEIIWEMIPVDHIDRVEVVKGAGSALYGSSAMGGVINVIPSRIPDGTHAAVRLSGALYEEPPYDEWSWAGRMRTLSQGSILLSRGTRSWGTVFSATRWMDESHRQNDVTHRYAFYNRTWLALTEGWSMDLTGHYVHRKGGNFFWWKSLRSPLQPPEDYAARQVYSDRGFIAATVRGVHSNRTASFLRLQFYANKWSDEDGTVVTTEARSTRVFGEGQLTTELLPDYHVVAGVNVYLDNVRSNIFGEHPGVGVAAFLQNEYAVLPNMDISAGIRLDWQQVSGLAAGSQFDPRVAVSYRLTELVSARASVGTGFRYPSIGELYTSISTGFGGVNVVPNPNLKPERSVSYEAGARYQYSGSGWVDAAVFRSEYDGLIEAGVDAQQLIIRFDNVEKARIQGVEVAAEQMIRSYGLTVRGGYTYIDPRDVETDRTLRFRPRHVAVAGLTYGSGAFTAAVDYRYVSRVQEIDANLVTVAAIKDGEQREDIHTVNLRGTWSLAGWSVPLRVGFEVRNATNHQYVELLANLAPPRTYMVTLETLL